MNKIKALYINEMIKISKKVSILILTLFMILGVVGTGALMKVQAHMESQGGRTQVDSSDWMFDEMRHQQEMIREELDKIEAGIENLAEDEDSLELKNLIEQREMLKSEIAVYERAIDEEIRLFDGDTFLSQSLYGIQNAEAKLRELNNVPEDMREADWEQQITHEQSLIDGYNQVLESKSFADFIDLETKRLQQSDMSEADLSREMERLTLWQKLDPSGGIDASANNYQVTSIIDEVRTLRQSLDDYIDYSGQMGAPVPLTPDRYEEVENQLAVTLYRIDHQMTNIRYNNSYADMAASTMYGFGSFMIVMMILILAGGSISQEIATGSIKSLIISPARRWKIFLAKVLSLVTVSLAAVLVLYLVGMLTQGLLFGFDSGMPYVYASGGKAASMAFPLFQFASLLVRWIDVLVFLAFALMLSVMTRNTAAAVGISLAAYFGSSLVQNVLMFLPAAEWVKFLPFSHIGLTDRFFPFANQMMNMGYVSGYMSGGAQPSLTFSLIYLAVLIGCLMYTALDSFTRRDIK